MTERKIPIQIAIILAPLVLFSALILTGKALFWGTPSTQFIPWWDFAWRSIFRGELPLWNPWVGMGAPLAANYQSALFYPPYWIYSIFYAAGGTEWMAWSVTLVVCGHLIWAGWGMARLLAELQARELGQTLGALAFSLSGYLVARAGFLSVNAAVSWLPWVLLGVLNLAKGKGGARRCLTGSMAMLLLAGHAQTAWYILLLGCIWLVYWSVQLSPAGEANGRSLGRGLLNFLIAGVLAAGISAVQLIPTLEYLLNSPRAGEYGYAQAMTYSFWPWRFLTLLVPDLFGSPVQGSYWGYGNFWEDAVYIGLLPLLLALGVLFRSISGREPGSEEAKKGRSGSLILLLFCITAVGFLLALGSNTPIFPFLYRFVPSFDLFQAPTRWSIWAVFSLSLLAGLGADSISKPTGKRLYFTRLAAAGSLAVAVGAGLGWILLTDADPTFFSGTALAGGIGFLAALLILSVPDQKDRAKYKAWEAGVVALVVFDLILAGWGLNPGIERGFYQEARVESPEQAGRDWIPAADEYQLKYNRYFLFDGYQPLADWETMSDIPLPNLGMLQGREAVNNFDPLVPRNYQLWISRVERAEERGSLLDMMAVSRIIRTADQGILIEDRVLPADSRLRVVGCQLIEGGQNKILETVMADPELYYKNVAVANARDLDCSPDISGTARTVEHKNGYLKAEVELNQEGWLFWSQTWYPGWKARIDGGRLLSTEAANYVFQAVPVPPGKHQVEFVYRPAGFIWGGAITLSCLGLWVFLGLKSRRRD